MRATPPALTESRMTGLLLTPHITTGTISLKDERILMTLSKRSRKVSKGKNQRSGYFFTVMIIFMQITVVLL